MPPAPPQPEPEPEQGPSEVDLLKQELSQLKSSYDELRSSKDSHINQINERVNLLDSMLQDQLSARNAPQNTPEPAQPVLEEDDFWSNYLGYSQVNSKPQPQQTQETVQEETPQMDPKDIRKIARDELRNQSQKAHELLMKQQQEAEQLKQTFQEKYRHLHHVSDKVTELYNQLSEANPNMSQSERFQRAVTTAERLFPAQNNTPPSPSIPTGGQGMPTYHQSGTASMRPMMNGFPIRDAAAAKQATNDHVYEMKQARQRRKGLF